MSFLAKNGKLAGTILASTTAILLLVQPAFAIDEGGIVSGGSIFLETTIAVAMVFITAMAFSLQIARGYFLRTLEKFTLRLGADIWWLAYVLIRDGLLFISFVMGLMVFFPGTFQDYDMAVPFMPLSVVFFGAALITKLYFDADESRAVFRAVTLMIFAGTMLWITGVIFVTETPLALGTLPAGVSASSFWGTFYNSFSSIQNPDLAMNSFYVASAMLSVIGILGLAHPLLHSRINRSYKGLEQHSQPPAAPSQFPTRATSRPPAPAEPGQQEYFGSQQAPAGSRVNRADYIQ